jgi:DNA-binding MarR family transcriptional regulator
MENKDREEVKQAFATIKRLAPKIYKTLQEGFYVVNCPKRNDIEQIESAVEIYLYAKGINITPRARQLLVGYVKYGTSTEARKKIRRQINMTAGTLNQNTSSLKKAGLIIYPYKDSKKSYVVTQLVKLREYMISKGRKKGNLLIRYNE